METTTKTFDRIASNQKRSLVRDLCVAAALVLGMAVAGQSMATTASLTPSIAPAAADVQVAQAETECFIAFGDATC